MQHSVSFIHRLEFNSVDAQLCSNLFLYDVDNDKDIELVIGQWQSGELQNYGEADVESQFGKLSVFKYEKLWRHAENLGMVISVGAGDICNTQQTLITVLCSDSHFYLFDVNRLVPKQTADQNEEMSDVGQLEIFHHERLPHNPKNVIISDLDGDGECEVLIGYTDRVVRMYRWQGQPPGSSRPGHMALLRVWELSGQIGSMSLHWTPEEGTQIMVSQPGRAYVVLKHESIDGDSEDGNQVPSLVYHPLGSTHARNVNANSEILGSIRRTKGSPGVTLENKPTKGSSSLSPYFAMCSVDGTIMLMDGREVLWALQVERELFGMSKVDLTNDDAEEVVICSWDGLTYIVNHHKEVVRFQPGYPVQAFLAGSYAVAPGKNQPVLIYATFDSQLMVYYNVTFPHIPCLCLDHQLSDTLKSRFAEREIDVSDRNRLRSATRWLLYESPKRQ